MDDDVIGAVNVGQKAIFELLGQPLTPVYRQTEAA
jgi:hypothetical protein